jgi:hypothetical protein
MDGDVCLFIIGVAGPVLHGVWLLPPARKRRLARHLRHAPHCLKGALFKALVELFSSCLLREAEQEPARLLIKVIPRLRLLDFFPVLQLLCRAYDRRDCDPASHASKAHQQKPALKVEGSKRGTVSGKSLMSCHPSGLGGRGWSCRADGRLLGN